MLDTIQKKSNAEKTSIENNYINITILFNYYIIKKMPSSRKLFPHPPQFLIPNWIYFSTVITCF